MSKLCVECQRPLSGRAARRRHARCKQRAAKKRYRDHLRRAGLTTRQSFKDHQRQEVTA